MTDRPEAERVKLALRLAIVSARLKETREALARITAELSADDAGGARTEPPAGRVRAHPTSTGGGTTPRSRPLRRRHASSSHQLARCAGGRS